MHRACVDYPVAHMRHTNNLRGIYLIFSVFFRFDEYPEITMTEGGNKQTKKKALKKEQTSDCMSYLYQSFSCQGKRGAVADCQSPGHHWALHLPNTTRYSIHTHLFIFFNTIHKLAYLPGQVLLEPNKKDF